MKLRSTLTTVFFTLSLIAAATIQAAVTPLHRAAARQDIAEINTLLGAGADVNALDLDDQTPLHWFATGENADPIDGLEGPILVGNEQIVVNALGDAGANLEAQDGDGNTPLHLAAEANNVSTIRALIGRGANVNTYNHDEKTPLDLACTPPSGGIAAAYELITTDSILDEIVVDTLDYIYNQMEHPEGGFEGELPQSEMDHLQELAGLCSQYLDGNLQVADDLGNVEAPVEEL